MSPRGARKLDESRHDADRNEDLNMAVKDPLARMESGHVEEFNGKRKPGKSGGESGNRGFSGRCWAGGPGFGSRGRREEAWRRWRFGSGVATRAPWRARLERRGWVEPPRRVMVRASPAGGARAPVAMAVRIHRAGGDSGAVAGGGSRISPGSSDGSAVDRASRRSIVRAPRLVARSAGVGRVPKIAEGLPVFHADGAPVRR
jgi:hypothetical protein